MHLRYACVKISPEDNAEDGLFGLRDYADDSFRNFFSFTIEPFSSFISYGKFRIQNIRFNQASYGKIYGGSQNLLQEIQE